MTRKACVIGWPISHSRSPLIHGYWLERYGIAGSYERIPVKPEDLPAFFSGLTGQGFAGCNVTLPHKEAAFRSMRTADAATARLGVVNTVFGRDGELNVLDVKCLLDVERYRRIDVDARRPAEVYPGGDVMAPEHNVRFLAECVRRLPAVNFAARDSGRIYTRTESGRLAWIDPEMLAQAAADPETRAGILAVAPEALGANAIARGGATLRAADFHTLGRWGETGER